MCYLDTLTFGKCKTVKTQKIQTFQQRRCTKAAWLRTRCKKAAWPSSCIKHAAVAHAQCSLDLFNIHTMSSDEKEETRGATMRKRSREEIAARLQEMQAMMVDLKKVHTSVVSQYQYTSRLVVNQLCCFVLVY